VDRGQGLSGGSMELGLAAASGHGGLQRGWQRKEGDTVQPGDRSPDVGPRRTGGGILAPSGDGVGAREDGRR
jgi:hypothetical protein